jgi:hypothetical protein
VESEEIMSAKDLYHDAFVRVLQRDGWTGMRDLLTIFFPDDALLPVASWHDFRNQ